MPVYRFNFFLHIQCALPRRGAMRRPRRGPVRPWTPFTSALSPLHTIGPARHGFGLASSEASLASASRA